MDSQNQQLENGLMYLMWETKIDSLLSKQQLKVSVMLLTKTKFI